MNKIIISLIAIVVVIAGAFLLMNGKNEAPSASMTPLVTASVSPSPSVSPTPTATTSPKTSPTGTPVSSAIKTFVVVGKPYSFTPSQITVNKGDTVKITFQNSGGNHDWRLDEFNAKTDVIGAGQEQTIQFVADKTGTFEYYCSVGTHRQMGMKGTLTVK